jgi:glucokinase
MAKTILAVDIGGTNSRFGWFEVPPAGQSGADGTIALLDTRWLPTAGASSFAGLFRSLAAGGFGLDAGRADVAVIAVAGPVRGTLATPPNIAWDVDLTALPGYDPARTFLVNDFVAQAFACRTDAVAGAVTVNPGRPDPAGVVAAVGAGTGLGHCGLAPLPAPARGGFVALPSEAGHASFAFHGEDEIGYMRFLLERTGRPYPVGDLVVSGPGLALLHEHLTGERLTPAQTGAALASSARTLELFATFYGRACRNYALAVMATGGVYVTGGVAAKIPETVTHPAFMAEFLDSATHADLLRDIPVRLNLNEDSGLWGAAFYGYNILAAAGLV